MNKSKFIKISFGIILICLFILLFYGIGRYRVKKAEEKSYTYYQTKEIPTSEKSGLWFECSRSVDLWEYNDFLGAQYDVSLYNFTDYELFDWEIKITIPEGSYIDSSWNGIFQIDGDKLFLSAREYNEIIKNQVYPFGFILYVPYSEKNLEWRLVEYQIDYKKYLAMGDIYNIWIVALLCSLIAIATTVFVVLKLKVKEAKKRQLDLKNIIEQALTTFANAIDAKDTYTEGHSRRVAFYSRELALRMGFSFEEQEQIFYIAMMHDIGKIGIPDSILKKPSNLTEEEWETMKQHSIYSGDILEEFTTIPKMSESVRYHHEWYDGNGYPYKLKGEEIPEISRIISVADSFDTMNSKRVYRGPLPKEKIIDQLKENSGIQFDPKVVPFMISMIEDGTIEKLKQLV